jgi:hypothetical protein
MDKPQLLQKFGHKESPYERPNQKWVCGKLSQGCPCELGPDKGGKCRVDFQCKPKGNATGDSWEMYPFLCFWREVCRRPFT